MKTCNNRSVAVKTKECISAWANFKSILEDRIELSAECALQGDLLFVLESGRFHFIRSDTNSLPCHVQYPSFLLTAELFNRVSFFRSLLVTCTIYVWIKYFTLIEKCGFRTLVHVLRATGAASTVRFNLPNSLKIAGQIGSQMPLVFTARYGFALAAISSHAEHLEWGGGP